MNRTETGMAGAYNEYFKSAATVVLTGAVSGADNIQTVSLTAATWPSLR
jgi:hypothetical protein